MLVHLGTPAQPTKKAVKDYLKKFLSDPFVIDLPRIFWLPLLYGINLRVRPEKSARLYQKVWSEKESPLLVHTRNQSEKLQEKWMSASVKYAMTYSEPSIAVCLDEFEAEKIQRMPQVNFVSLFFNNKNIMIF